MSRVAINTGSVANDGTGDSLRIAGGIINDNFSEIYSQFGDGTNLTPTWDKTAAGINTTSSVGIGTTNPRFTLEVGAVGASGTSLWVNGNARVTGILTVGSSSIVLDGNANKILVGSGISFDGNTGIISATAFYAGGSIISGGGSGGGLNYWGSSASGISTTANVAIGTVTPTSKLTVVGNSLFSGIATFRNNLTLANLTSSSNTLRFGSNSYIDQSNSDVFTFQINSGTNGSGTDSSFVFRTTKPGSSPIPDQAYDALRVYSGGNYWNRLVRVYTNFHADNNAFVGGNLQVGAASTLIGVGNTLGSFKVGAGGTVITTTSAGLVGIGTTNPRARFQVGSASTITNEFIITSSGDVGIGTEIPVHYDGFSSLTLDGKAYQNGPLTQYGGGSISLKSRGNNALNIYSYSSANGISTATNIDLYHDLYFLGSTGTNLLVVTESGNVGIGTTATNSKLHVVGISTFNGSVYIDDQLYVSGVQITGAGGTGSVASIGEDISTRNLSVSGISTLSIGGAGNSEAVYFQSKTQPQASLKISQATGNDDGVLITFSSSGGDTATIETDSNSNLTISTQNTLNLRANTNQTVLQSAGSSVDLYYSGIKKFETLGAGVTVTGTTFTNQLSVSGVSTLSSNVSVGGTISIDGGVALATNNATIVGTSGTTGEIKQIGGAPFYYDGSAWREFVLSSGTPVSVPADTEWDSVVLRTTFDTDFTDAKFGATPVRVSSGSTIVGSPVKIGTGAFRNDGSVGAGISYVYRSDYDFTGSWTIEFWIYHDSPVSSYQSLVSQVSTIDGSGDWSFGLYNNGFNHYWYWDNESNATAITLYIDSNASFNSNFLNKWVHYTLVREGDNGSLHFYINGVETVYTISDGAIDNNILHINGAGLGFGAAFGNSIPNINGKNWNDGISIDAIFDDVRISCGVGTAGQRYNSIGITTYATFTPPTTALPTTGTLSSYVQPPGDKYGEITLGGSPTWRGTSGVTVSQQSSGNYRVSFASTYTDSNDYYVLSQGMDQGFASYVGVARSTTHVDFTINKESDDSAVDTGSLSVQIKNHI